MARGPDQGERGQGLSLCHRVCTTCAHRPRGGVHRRRHLHRVEGVRRWGSGGTSAHVRWRLGGGRGAPLQIETFAVEAPHGLHRRELADRRGRASDPSEVSNCFIREVCHARRVDGVRLYIRSTLGRWLTRPSRAPTAERCCAGRPRTSDAMDVATSGPAARARLAIRRSGTAAWRRLRQPRSPGGSAVVVGQRPAAQDGRVDPIPETPRRPRAQDVAALIGLLAVLEGEVWAADCGGPRRSQSAPALRPR